MCSTEESRKIRALLDNSLTKCATEANKVGKKTQSDIALKLGDLKQ